MTDTSQDAATPEIDPAVLAKLNELRSHVRQTYGHVVMAMMALPRYRHQTLADLQHLVLDPLVHDRIAIAYSRKAEGDVQPDVAGMAIWASVSEEVDAKIREQIKGGAFPIRLKQNEWNSGDINWLLDILSTDRKTTGSVLANFKQVVKDGELRLHPLVGKLIEPEMLEKISRKPEPVED
ncbi:toxin-activating lysine-acyltransferase [Sagittula sp. S175]|uniref:toxin-activating lysine-acyltransferase n=1 Tax=Sagittula sp. S175 TaxID=3415129 RepID=UPI003C7B3CDB